MSTCCGSHDGRLQALSKRSECSLLFIMAQFLLLYMAVLFILVRLGGQNEEHSCEKKAEKNTAENA
jgi:hypothetical protein